MENRVLRYFLTVAREENITRAAQVLHITQPTLSRQLTQLEDEVGTKLFVRGTRKIALTNQGVLLRCRAEEILALVDKTQLELSEEENSVEGTVFIGCGDLGSVEILAELFKTFQTRYPAVTFDLCTATADHVKDRMERGIIDVGLLLEPISMEKYEFVRLPQKEQWVVAMSSNSPLAQQEFVTVSDLKDLPLILPTRLNVQSELASWFGKDFDKLNALFTSNLPANSSIMAYHKLGYAITIKGSIVLSDKEKIIYRPLYPNLTATCVLAWRRQQPFGIATSKFIDHIKENYSSTLLSD